jgi:hypothetical protein
MWDSSSRVDRRGIKDTMMVARACHSIKLILAGPGEGIDDLLGVSIGLLLDLQEHLSRER